MRVCTLETSAAVKAAFSASALRTGDLASLEFTDVSDPLDVWVMPKLLLRARRTLPNSFFIPSELVGDLTGDAGPESICGAASRFKFAGGSRAARYSKYGDEGWTKQPRMMLPAGTELVMELNRPMTMTVASGGQ